MINLANSNIKNPQYSEAAALQQLMQVTYDTLTAMSDNYEQTANDDYLDEQFTINVGGASIAFLLGGPQAQALMNFIECIADENDYLVDFDKSTVTE